MSIVYLDPQTITGNVVRMYNVYRIWEEDTEERALPGAVMHISDVKRG